MAITGISVLSMEKWPEKTETRSRKQASFKANWFNTEKLLARECREVSAANIKLHTFHRKSELRQDGWVRGDARRPSHPGVILEFEKRITGSADREKLRFPCDTFTKWEDNVRAIALALEALRKIDRYGVTTGAQYAGYKALPPAIPGTEGQSPEQAAIFIATKALLGEPDSVATSILLNPQFAELAYKTAAKLVHPEKEGGDIEEFKKLNNSMAVVRNHFEEPK